MAKQTIDIGTTGNDGTGDDLRTGAIKINQNFDELYADVAGLQAAGGSSIAGIGFDSGRIVFEGATNDSNETILQVVDPTKDNILTLPDSTGTVALITDITNVVDSNYISLITGTAFDSNSTLLIVQANSVDSTGVTGIVDSSYVAARVFAADSADFITKIAAIKGNIIPDVDSAYDLGSSSKKWRDLYLSGTTLHLGGQTISNNGSSFNFSQEIASGANNMSVDSGNGFFVNQYANISTGTRGGGYSAQGFSLKVEGNTVQFATVDGIVTAELVTNEGLSNFNDPFGAGGAISVPDITTAQRATVAARSQFRIGSMAYNTDSNRFNLYDSDGWFSISREFVEAADIGLTVDSAFVQNRADKLKLRVYTVGTAPSGVQGNMIYVSDGASGSPCLAVHDGSTYKRIALGATIST